MDCAELKVWLSGPGTRADPEAYKVALRGYLALCNSVLLLPRGAEALIRAKAVDRDRQAPAVIPSSHFDQLGDRAALLTEPVLTEHGWIVPDQPRQLVAYVERLQEQARAAGQDATAKAVLRSMIHRLAEQDGESSLRAELRQLGALEKRLSVARRAITRRPQKGAPKAR